jgi:hypothetical protein
VLSCGGPPRTPPLALCEDPGKLRFPNKPFEKPCCLKNGGAGPEY